MLLAIEEEAMIEIGRREADKGRFDEGMMELTHAEKVQRVKDDIIFRELANQAEVKINERAEKKEILHNIETKSLIELQKYIE